MDLFACESFARCKLIQLAKEQATPPRCPTQKECSLVRKLNAAFILRGEFATVFADIQVCYNILPEFTLFHVISQNKIRQWGKVEDLQELSAEVEYVYPQGIYLLHHDVNQAFHFQSSGAGNSKYVATHVVFNCFGGCEKSA